MPNCRDCKAPIKFARFGDRTIPVDALGDHEGSYVLFHESDVLSARPARLPLDYSRPRHRHHFDTCKSRRYRKAPQR
jgi:hypothetical protein